MARSGKQDNAIPALMPRDAGYQFVVYGDSCSGIAGGRHAETFAAINRIVARLAPAPECILFLGDEIAGLTGDPDVLRAQWRYWRDVEMAWLDRSAVPLYHTTSNHTTYDHMSEQVFAEMLPDLPRNGPEGQKGLSYYIRDGDLLLVFIHTAWTEGGGEGRMELAWLTRVLAQHQDAAYKFVAGHHPVFPVNGYAGEGQRTLFEEAGSALWRLLTANGVTAYLCSHILAFDVQVHAGVLQILTAGAGTAHRMPEEQEYLHCLQMAVDRDGIRYQVLDRDAVIRERLTWPLPLPPVGEWQALTTGRQSSPFPQLSDENLLLLAISCTLTGEPPAAPQTLLAAWQDGPWLTNLWIGLTGDRQQLTVTLAPWTGRSPHYWFGPELGAPSRTYPNISLHVCLHAGMGPGGILWRWDDTCPWQSLSAASPWGAEALPALDHWAIGHDKFPVDRRSFAGQNLRVQRLEYRNPDEGSPE